MDRRTLPAGEQRMLAGLSSAGRLGNNAHEHLEHRNAVVRPGDSAWAQLAVTAPDGQTHGRSRGEASAPEAGEGRRRRPRDPAATREAILEAALTLLARHGPEAISLSDVAHLAGVNRGTAYQHFATREKLIEAAAAWASDWMFRTVFGNGSSRGERPVEEIDIAEVNERVTGLAMDNPELCRIWLLQVLASPDPAADPFWRVYEGSIRRWAATGLSRDSIDSEALAVLMLAGTFLWPVWARSHAKSERERAELARRFSNEVLRLSLFGTMRPERYPEIVSRLAEAQSEADPPRAAAAWR